MSLIIWSYIFGGATLFGVIVGIFSVWNGRRTRADLREVLQSIGQKMDEGFRRMDEWFRKMDERAEQRHREVMQQHQDMVELMRQQHQDTVELLKKGFSGSAGATT